MKKGLDIKFMAIIVLTIGIVSMSVAFAALTQNITITGVAGIGDASWKVEITNFSELMVSGATTNGFGKSVTSATFDVALDYPGAYAIYELTIKNKGTINAKFEDVIGVEAANDSQPDAIQFTVTRMNHDSNLLPKGEEEKIQIKVEWILDDDVPQVDRSKTATITFNYIQDTTN